VIRVPPDLIRFSLCNVEPFVQDGVTFVNRPLLRSKTIVTCNEDVLLRGRCSEPRTSVCVLMILRACSLRRKSVSFLKSFLCHEC
jgi:hypothetical protein